MNRVLRYDAVVVGAGLHGLVAGTRLAQAGARVVVIARGHGSLQLAPGTFDEPIEPEISGWLKATVASGRLPGYAYMDAPAGEMALPTALGLRKRVWLAPSTMVSGDSGLSCEPGEPGEPGVRGVRGVRGEPSGSSRCEKSTTTVPFSHRVQRNAGVAIVGTPGLRDFQASLCAANLSAGGTPARAVEFDWQLDRADANSVQVARCFDAAAWRAQFIATLESLLSGRDEVIGLPAVLGLKDPGAVHAELEQRLGRPVFEIPTLPPSVPGMRLYEIFRTSLGAAGGRLLIGPRVEIETATQPDGRARTGSVIAASAGESTRYCADKIVFATGEDAATNGQALTRGYRAVEVLG